MRIRPRHARAQHSRLAAITAAGLVCCSLLAGATAAKAGAAPGSPHSPAGSTTRPLTAGAASVQAQVTGHAVTADALTTPTSQTTANPDGTFTLTQNAEPVRVRKHGAWVNLDATLNVNADGTLSPAASASPLVLSGGGSGALAVMSSGGRQLTLTLPAILPAPALSGATATYSNVLPDTDLVVTADPEGGFSDVLVVKTAAAAANPSLLPLLTATVTTGTDLKLTTDTTGNVSAVDSAGNPVFMAPPAKAWDSATGRSSGTGGSNQNSSADGPGLAASVASMAVTSTSNSITLSPPTTLLTGSATVFPLYLDPWYTPSYGNSGWATFGSGYPNDSHWNSTTDPTTGINQIGNTDSGAGTALTLFDFPVPSSLSGANINSATFGITNTHSWACLTSGHDMTVDLSAPSTTLTSSNATYSFWSGRLGANLPSSHSFAHGYTNCPAAAESFDVKSVVAGDVSSGKTTQTLALHADDGSDVYAFKEFQASSANLTVVYDHPPATPGGLRTAPATVCSGGTTLGLGSVSLYATGTDPDGGQLTDSYALWKTSDSTKTNLLTSANGVAGDQVVVTSGQSSMLEVPESLLTAQAAGATTGYTWSVSSSDGTLPSPGSASCSFTYDPTQPGAPSVAPTKSPTTGSTCATAGDTTDTIQQIGTLCSFTITPNAHGTAAAGYSYQLDDAPPVTVPGSALNSSGVAVITVRLSRLVNTLTVSALSSGGNAGPGAIAYFDGSAVNPPAADGDLTDDGVADLIVPGGTGTLPPGLWLAAGRTDGTTAATAVNIGSEGTGRNSAITPASSTDWTGAQAATGAYCGDGLQDVLAYYPAGASAGGGAVLCGNGAPAPLDLVSPVSGSQYTITTATFTDSPNNFTGNPAVEIAGAGDTSGNATGTPDQLAVIDNYLWLFSSASPTYSATLAVKLTNLPSPDGSFDWNSWTIATSQDPRNGSTPTDMYLWQPSSGSLFLWTALALSADQTTLTASGKYAVATNWNKAPVHTLVLRAANITGSGIPGLWVTDTTTQTATAYLPASLVSNPVIATAGTTLSAPAGIWPLNDGTGTSAADIAGPHPAALHGATWGNDTVRGTALNLNGTSYAATTTGVLDTTQAYTVSAWVNLGQASTTTDYEAVSQDGTQQSAFALGYFHTTGSWWFNKPCTDTATSGGSHVAPSTSTAPATPGTWTNLTAQYDPSHGAMRLYVNGVLAASGTDSCTQAPFAAPGPLAIGRGLYGAKANDFLPGQVSDVEVYQSLLTPGWIAAHAQVAPTHEWALTDGASATAADTKGDPATLVGGATWANDTTHGTVLSLDGTSGAASAAGPAFAPNADFTVSAWVKPAAQGGVVFSQNGSADSSFLVYPTGGSWTIGMNTGSTTSWSFNGAAGGTAQLGSWSQLTLTYSATSGALTLYVNGRPAVSLTDTSPPGTTGAFQIGDDQNSGARSAFFSGQISDVRVWNAAVPPYQPATVSGTLKTFVSQATSLCLDGNAAGNMYGSSCDTTSANSNAYQHWTMYLDANGYYRLQSEGTSRCLDGNAAGSIYSSPCDATNPYQHWFLWWDGAYYQLKSQATGRCLDGNAAGSIYSNSCTEAVNTNQYQHWK